MFPPARYCVNKMHIYAAKAPTLANNNIDMRFSVIRDGTRNAQAPWEILGRGYLDAGGQTMRFFHGRGKLYLCMFVVPSRVSYRPISDPDYTYPSTP